MVTTDQWWTYRFLQPVRRHEHGVWRGDPQDPWRLFPWADELCQKPPVCGWWARTQQPPVWCSGACAPSLVCCTSQGLMGHTPSLQFLSSSQIQRSGVTIKCSEIAFGTDWELTTVGIKWREQSHTEKKTKQLNYECSEHRKELSNESNIQSSNTFSSGESANQIYRVTLSAHHIIQLWKSYQRIRQYISK